DADVDTGTGANARLSLLQGMGLVLDLNDWHVRRRGRRRRGTSRRRGQDARNGAKWVRRQKLRGAENPVNLAHHPGCDVVAVALDTDSAYAPDWSRYSRSYRPPTAISSRWLPRSRTCP